MVNIDRLIATRGDARAILDLPTNGPIEWVDSIELARLEVLRGIAFEEFSVSNAEIGLNFVECDFKNCNFTKVKTSGHLWGAQDIWRSCHFDRCELRGMIAPMNSFFGCRFEAVSIQRFMPHQTLFEGCEFRRVNIEGLKAIMISNRQIANPNLAGCPSQIVFRKCHFESSAFLQCYFGGAAFSDCTFEDVEAKACSFEGIVSDVIWWDAQKADPFTVFLTKALELIGTKCGRESPAYREFENYTIDYATGRTASRDFSACLYNNRVPYSDTQRLIKDLRNIVSTFPF